MEQVDELGTITIMKDGKEVECEVLFTFENDELKKQKIDNIIIKNIIKILFFNINYLPLSIN